MEKLYVLCWSGARYEHSSGFYLTGLPVRGLEHIYYELSFSEPVFECLKEWISKSSRCPESYVTLHFDYQEYLPAISIRVERWLQESWFVRLLLESPGYWDLESVGVLPSYEPDECPPAIGSPKR